MAQAPAKRRDDDARAVATEAEQQLLGALLIDAAALAQIGAFLTGDHFADPTHAAIYEAIKALAAAGATPDPLAVFDALERQGFAPDDGSDVRQYLGALFANCPGPSVALRSAQMVAERARERRDRGEQRGARLAYAERDGALFAPDGRRVVRWTEGDLPSVLDQAEQALLESQESLFQRDKVVVRVVRRDVPTIANYRRPPGVLGLATVDPPFLVEALTRAALWERWDSRKEQFRRINAPEKVAVHLLSRVGRWKFPRLWDVISVPTLRPDGTILQEPGYDEATHVYYDPCGVKFPRIPENPSQYDARDAFDLIACAVASFPFDSEIDRAVALALFMTAVVRRSLPSAPLGAISAPVPRSGKTLLADCIAILATGTTAPAMAFAETDEEAKKTALAVLMEGDQVVLIDNVERPLSGDWLCSILTSETYQQRMLGKTEMVIVPTRTLMLATGNHIQVMGDLRFRTLLCRIDPKVENPEQREFEYDIKDRMRAQRPELVAAALTLMRAFISTGQDVHHLGIKPWGGFEAWSTMVRAPLVWMECEDPFKSLRTLEAEDPDRGTHLALLKLWRECFADEALTAKAVIDRLNVPSRLDREERLFGLLAEIATDRQGKVSPRRLGRWLAKRANARLGGLQVVSAGTQDHVLQWRVVETGRASAG